MTDLIISSRIRFARNIEGIPFETKEPNAFDSILDTIKSFKGFKIIKIADTLQEELEMLFQKRLCSRELVENKANGYLALGDNVQIMVGEEDHLRIQSIHDGLDFDSCLRDAKKVLDELSQKHKFAHDEKVGFVTSDPTNCGTGMRASVMMYLPRLAKSRKLEELQEQYQKEMINIRGAYGESGGGGA
jgi:protein arginine kinase